MKSPSPFVLEFARLFPMTTSITARLYRQFPARNGLDQPVRLILFAFVLLACSKNGDQYVRAHRDSRFQKLLPYYTWLSYPGETLNVLSGLALRCV